MGVGTGELRARRHAGLRAAGLTVIDGVWALPPEVIEDEGPPTAQQLQLPGADREPFVGLRGGPAVGLLPAVPLVFGEEARVLEEVIPQIAHAVSG